ncbi:hypothetical protein MNBD_GAMMA25-1002 [hydrothermal vent metagenome]|uniref:DUF7931 domain-containing protein n=1 Tax=hydrothermal vent metagenome TaxID=652676 RepID=A0A3B1BB20_9ZZZZ
MAIDLDKLKLGIDSGEYTLNSRADNYRYFWHMLQQSRQQLDIFSTHLDHKLYDTTEIITRLQSLIHQNQHTRIRLLLRNPRHLLSYGHRIVELSRRLSTYIEIRQLAETCDEHIESFCLFDRQGIIYRPNAEQFEGWFSFHAGVRVKSISGFFNEAWDTSLPCHETRRLYL